MTAQASSRTESQVDFRHSLTHPMETISILVQAKDSRLPWGVWLMLTIVAIGGSMIYGASLSLTLPQWRLSAGALWITLSAGFAWGLFLPSLTLIARQSPIIPIQACLVTMAYGEGVLTLGAIVNILLSRISQPLDPAVVNFSIVGISNVVMVTVLARQMRVVGVKLATTIALWMLVLNGSGAVFFFLLRRWLQGGQ